MEGDSHTASDLKISLLPKEGHQFGLAFVGIGICGEVKIMGGSILLTGVEHVLQGIEGGCQEPIVITLSENSMVTTLHPATRPPLL